MTDLKPLALADLIGKHVVAVERLGKRIVLELDGELFVARRTDGGVDRLEFEVLQERIHPAASRVARLAKETPASLVVFDLLALGDDDLSLSQYRLLAFLAQGD